MVNFNRILTISNEIIGELAVLSDHLYQCPELSSEECKSSRMHQELLKKYGFKISPMKEKHLETGFVAEFDSNKPGLSVAYLAEYDALPGVGHGCGHNLLGATSTGGGNHFQ